MLKPMRLTLNALARWGVGISEGSKEPRLRPIVEGAGSKTRATVAANPISG